MPDDLITLYHSLDKNIASLSEHVKFQNGRIEKLEKTDEKIFEKLEAFAPLLYKAGILFTLILTVIGAVMVKVLIN